MNLHGVLGPVVQDDSLSIELLIDKDVKVILILLNIDWHIYALSSHGKWDWLGVVLVLEKDGELLEATSQLIRNKCKLNFSL